MKTMSRRIEASVSRDWSFGFVTWSDLFRSTVNLSRSIYAYERKHGKDTGGNFTPQSLETKVLFESRQHGGQHIKMSMDNPNPSEET